MTHLALPAAALLLAALLTHLLWPFLDGLYGAQVAIAHLMPPAWP